MSREERTWLVVQIVLAGFVAAVGFHYMLGVYLRLPYPANTFLFDPSDVARDFLNIYGPVQGGAPYSSRLSVYFPFTYFPLWMLRATPAPVLLAAMLSLFVASVFLWFRRCLPELAHAPQVVALGILALLNYPVLICLDRGNVEIFVFLFLLGFIISVERESWLVASGFLAGAIAMKAYPGVFVVLLLARRQFLAVTTTGALTLLFTFGSAALYPGGVAGSLAGLQANLAFFRSEYVLGEASLGFNSSYFNLLKLWIGAHGLNTEASVLGLLLPYTVVCLGAFAVLSTLLVRAGAWALWKEVALLTLSMILLPQVSGDYKLVHLLLPLGLFLASQDEPRRAWLHAVLFGLLVIPKAYGWLLRDVSVAVPVNTMLMTVLGSSLLLDCWRAGRGWMAPAERSRGECAH